MAQSYYVVWQGHAPGIYQKWPDCRKQIENYPEPRYKKFESLDEANHAYRKGIEHYRKRKSGPQKMSRRAPKFRRDSLLVHTKVQGESMQINATYLKNNQKIFFVDFQRGNPEIGQFLATVKALKLLRKRSPTMPVYVPSLKVLNAINHKFLYDPYLGQRHIHDPWHEKLRECMFAAINWLKRNDYQNPVLHWNSTYWGEPPQ